MRTRLYSLLILFSLFLACRSSTSIPEPGSILLNVKCALGSPTPDELRAFVYDDTGVLWDNARIPASGSLNVKSRIDLGTVLIKVKSYQGALRVRMLGLLGGTRILEGALSIPAYDDKHRVFDIVLSGNPLPDQDGDGVPDSIDDCPDRANPAQQACPATAADAGVDAQTTLVPSDSGIMDTALGTPDSPVDGGYVSPDSKTDSNVPGRLDTSVAPADSATSSQDAPTSVALDAIGDAKPIVDSRVSNDLVLSIDSAEALDTNSTPDSSPLIDVATPVDTSVVPDGNQDTVQVPLKGQGKTCQAAGECASGFCADGVCCTNSCTGVCRSCDQVGSVGVCKGFQQGLDPDKECSGNKTCNGVGVCGTTPAIFLPEGQLCTKGNQCLSGFCVDGVCCDSACDSPCQACGTGECRSVLGVEDVQECMGANTCDLAGKCGPV